jgi:hypothetical protein
MAPRFIITTHWWADTSAVQAWPLLLQTARWPLWWTAVASTTAPVTPGPGRWPLRLALGRPLRLRIEHQAAQPREWLSLRLGGDLQGRANFMLDAAATPGLDITCRLELSNPHQHGRLLAPLFEVRLLAVLQSLVRDLGRALPCRVEIRGEWHGSARRH